MIGRFDSPAWRRGTERTTRISCHKFFVRAASHACHGFSNPTYKLLSQRVRDVKSLSMSWRHHIISVGWQIQQQINKIQIPQCTCSISNNAQFRTEMYTHFCSEWYIVGYGAGVLWDLSQWSMAVVWYIGYILRLEPRCNHHAVNMMIANDLGPVSI